MHSLLEAFSFVECDVFCKDESCFGCADCYFSNFSKDRDSAIKVNSEGLLTAVRSTFVNNTAFSKSDPEEKIIGGPHIGVYAGAPTIVALYLLQRHLDTQCKAGN